MRRGVRIAVVCGVVAVGAGAGSVRLLASGPASPLPLGTPQSEWTGPGGVPNAVAAPARALVSTFDGGILKDVSGNPVSVPLGQEVRGEISPAEADRQMADVERLQMEDACRRGVQVPLRGEGETMADSRRDLARKIAANGGRTTRSACADGG